MSRITNNLTRRYFLSLSKTSNNQAVRSVIREAAREAGFRTVEGFSSLSGKHVNASVASDLASSDCFIADLTDQRTDVYVEIGLAQAMGKPILLLCEKNVIVREPEALREFPWIFYEATDSGLAELRNKTHKTLQEFKRLPNGARLTSNHRFTSPFVVDWERLDRSDVDNLCFELLAQMGYREVGWNTRKGFEEVDIVAEYPKRDPDGYDYKELWLVALGRRYSSKKLVQMAFGDEAFLKHIAEMSDQVNILPHEKSYADKKLPIVLLIIIMGDMTVMNEDGDWREPLEVWLNKRSSSPDIRVRIWDRPYLTSLVQQFPQIGYKYFSDEARAQSKYRKTPEELYDENIALSRRQAELITALEAEKNMRVRAERDAVWKDIAFTTAHKIGNPIFAIETYLAPLEKRIRENRVNDADKIVKKIGVSVEKAKGIIEQFKSLTKAQEITRAPIRLLPILEEACALARSQGVTVTIDCAADVTVSGDVERLTECFDELVVNSTHWFDKAEKTVTIQVTSPAPLPLPAFLDSTHTYVLVNYQDNGSGVALELKNDIFNAFSTTRDQGTGLGLALVRRIVEGHGGAIYESGIPGKGASFFIYLPMADEPRSPALTAAAPRKRKQSTRGKKE